MKAEMGIEGDIWEVHCRGIFVRQDMLNLIDSIDEGRSRHPGIRKCLMDIRNAVFEMGVIGEFYVGEHASRKLAGMCVSVVMKKGQVNKLLEDAAYNRGLRISMVESRDAAVAWLNA